MKGGTFIITGVAIAEGKEQNMFGRNRDKGEPEWEGRYWDALQKKRVPLLTLDPRWHQLFPEHTKSKELKRKEEALQALVKKQGQTNNDLKEYEKARKVVMENVLQNMTDGNEQDSDVRGKKQDANQKLLEELKDKIRDVKEIQEALPEQIKEANQELLLQSMRECYDTLVGNTSAIRYEEQKIQEMRAELTEHILKKQDMEMKSSETYKFMYDLLGAELLNIFDREYDVWKGKA